MPTSSKKVKAPVARKPAARVSKAKSTATHAIGTRARLTLGPLMFNWAADKQRDFYFRIADESCVDVVYLGEVVCSKREPFFDAYRQAVIERLQRAGKEVVLSSLALMTTPREIETVEAAAASGLLVEANDVAALTVLAGKPFVVGPFINVLNEGAYDFMARQGAVRVVVPVEISQTAVGILAAHKKGPEIELQVFGRQALSVSMRCYHSRANGRDKDHCQMACAADPDGLAIQTLDGQEVLTVNGTSVLSHGYSVLLKEMIALQKQGVKYFRLAAHPVDMVRVSTLFRSVLDGQMSPDSAQESLTGIVPNLPFINGFMHTRAGMNWIADAD